MKATWYSCSQEEAALYAEGKGTEAEQVLQATHNSKGCHMLQSTCVAADFAHSGSMETARMQACKAQEMN